MVMPLNEVGKMEKAQICRRLLGTYWDIINFSAEAVKCSEEEFRYAAQYKGWTSEKWFGLEVYI